MREQNEIQMRLRSHSIDQSMATKQKCSPFFTKLFLRKYFYIEVSPRIPTKPSSPSS